ncbi:MAG: leucine--tRNA ligase [Thermoguttaceae bacterium]
MRYNPSEIEPKWQNYWETNRTFETPSWPKPGTEKMYVLDMFPYPSANGLHVGHPEGYTATDIVCRFARMNGKTVLHPMGWDAFGLPAEQQAKKTGTPPRIITETNIANFRRQLKMLGFSYDWSREIATTDLNYFKWTQFIFLLLHDTWFDLDEQKGRPIAELPIPAEISDQGPDAVEQYKDEHRLAYQIEAPVNWCPELGTVLSNEEVVQGRSERGNHPVVRMPLRQWMLRITSYADRLESDLELLDWSDGIKALQRNWIGRSTGAEIDFYIGQNRTTPIISNEGCPTGRSGSVAPINSNQTTPASSYNYNGEESVTGPKSWRKSIRQEYDKWKESRENFGFSRKPGEDCLRIYTTRPDTLFGATYMVIAPEHPLVKRLTIPEQRAAVDEYCQKAASKSDMDRTELAKEKTGVFTGSYAINPVNDEPIPIWIADYVLISYGTGAIMAVPAHDTRDYEFAKKFSLPIVQVVQHPPHTAGIGVDFEAFTESGVAVNSGTYNGLVTAEFKEKITHDLNQSGRGRKSVNYKLRDWLFSRQHFWGEPFPILHELDENANKTGRTIALEPSELPLDMPLGLKFDATHNSPEPPLEHASDEWLFVQKNGKRYKRETNTMPQWAGSCWYYLRFIDPKNDKLLIDPSLEKAWMPVDLYIGGAEHAVLHLLYARFWHKVLFDRGFVSMPEPFQKLVNQGMILGEDGQKMSKSRGNVINPDDVVTKYGADALRLYEMFMGPLESVKPWSMDGVNGVRNFLDRVWKMMIDESDESQSLHPKLVDASLNEEQNRILHKTIKAVTEDILNKSFNTAIARMMEFTNFFLKQEFRSKNAMEIFLLLLSPFAPHLAEELWERLGHKTTLAFENWPKYDESALIESTLEIPVSINGKLRAKIIVSADSDTNTIESLALSDPKIIEWITGKSILKKIIVPGKMVNFVVK